MTNIPMIVFTFLPLGESTEPFILSKAIEPFFTSSQ